MNKTIQIWTDNVDGYELLDSGDHQKLERVGSDLIIRSEPRAWWKKELPDSEWNKAVAVYAREDRGNWSFKKQPAEAIVEAASLKSKIHFTKTSKHIGIFPEQSAQWKWIQEKIKGVKGSKGGNGEEVKVLNLFGYTGMGSLAAAAAGAQVTHVDGSQVAIKWGRENQELSGLADKPIRWILDDVVKFVKREINRGKKYDCLILDPPAFGRGPKGQVWKVEKDLPYLLDLCRQVLSDDPLFVILTMYAIESSSLSLGNLVSDLMKGYKGNIFSGELSVRHKSSDKLLPMSIFSIWEKINK